MRFLTVLLLATALASGMAAPPPGHPSPDEAARLLNIPDASGRNLPYVGRVIQAIDSNNYTYLQVTVNDGARWLAAPKAVFPKNVVIRYGDGALMRNFYSKVLKRTFSEILFVANVQVIREGI